MYKMVNGGIRPLSLSWAKKEFRVKNSNAISQKVTEVEVNQLGCVGAGNKLQRQKKDP